jgi:hypothetical protein
MGAPSETAVKTLFAMSRNLCFYAEPPEPESDHWGAGCEAKLTDPKWKQVNGEVAHIKGDAPLAPRYDKDQPETERQGFDNLMLLCPSHHKRIDRLEPERHTVTVLLEMKERHLSRAEDATQLWYTDDVLVRVAEEAISQAVRAAILDEASPEPRAALRKFPAPTAGPRLTARTEGLVLQIVNVGDDDAYGIEVDMPDILRTAGAFVSVPGLPPGLMPPGASWAAGSFQDLTGAQERPFTVRWLNRGGRVFEQSLRI